MIVGTAGFAFAFEDAVLGAVGDLIGTDDEAIAVGLGIDGDAFTLSLPASFAELGEFTGGVGMFGGNMCA